VHFCEVVLKVNPFTLLLAFAAVVHPSTEEYFYAVLTAKIDPLSATPSCISNDAVAWNGKDIKIAVILIFFII